MKEIDYITLELAKWIADYNNDYRNWSDYQSAILGSMNWTKDSWVLDVRDLLHYGPQMYAVKDLTPLVDELQTTERGSVKLIHKDYLSDYVEDFFNDVIAGEPRAISDYHSMLKDKERFFDDYVWVDGEDEHEFEMNHGFAPDDWNEQDIEEFFSGTGDFWWMTDHSEELKEIFNKKLDNPTDTFQKIYDLSPSSYIGLPNSELGKFQELKKELSQPTSKPPLPAQYVKKFKSLFSESEESAIQAKELLDAIIDDYDFTALIPEIQTLIDTEADKIEEVIIEAFGTVPSRIDQEKDNLYHTAKDEFTSSYEEDVVHSRTSYAITNNKLTHDELIDLISQDSLVELVQDLHYVYEHPRLNLYFGKA